MPWRMSEEEAIRRGFMPAPPPPPEPVRPPVVSTEESRRIIDELNRIRWSKRPPLFSHKFKTAILTIIAWLVGFMCGLMAGR